MVRLYQHCLFSWQKQVLRYITDLQARVAQSGDQNFQLSSSFELPPLLKTQELNLFQETLACPSGTGSVLFTGTATLDYDLVYTLTTSGALASDDIEQFIFTASERYFLRSLMFCF